MASNRRTREGHARQYNARGTIVSRSFSILYLKDGRVIAIDSVNATRDYVQGRALVTNGAVIAPDLLGDADIPLKDREKAAS